MRWPKPAGHLFPPSWPRIALPATRCLAVLMEPRRATALRLTCVLAYMAVCPCLARALGCRPAACQVQERDGCRFMVQSCMVCCRSRRERVRHTAGVSSVCSHACSAGQRPRHRRVGASRPHQVFACRVSDPVRTLHNGPPSATADVRRVVTRKTPARYQPMHCGRQQALA